MGFRAVCPSGRIRADVHASDFLSAAAAPGRVSEPAPERRLPGPQAAGGLCGFSSRPCALFPLRPRHELFRHVWEGKGPESGSSPADVRSARTHLPSFRRCFSARSDGRGRLRRKGIECLCRPWVPVPEAQAEGFLGAQRPVPPTLPHCVLPLFQKRDAMRPRSGPGRGSPQTGPLRKTVR